MSVVAGTINLINELLSANKIGSQHFEVAKMIHRYEMPHETFDYVLLKVQNGEFGEL